MPTFVIREPQGRRLTYACNRRQLTIGRGDQASLVLRDDNVSRVHAGLFRLDDGWAIEDLRSRNGTWVNGRRVTRRALKSTDTVRIGEYELVYYSDEDSLAGMHSKAGARRAVPWNGRAEPDGSITSVNVLLKDQPEGPSVTDRRRARIRPFDLRKSGLRPGTAGLVFGGKDGIEVKRMFNVGAAAKVVWGGKGHFVHKLSPFTAVMVNDEPADPNKMLENRDVIRVGGSVFTYRVTIKSTS